MLQRVLFLRQFVNCGKVLEKWHGYKRCHSAARQPSSSIWLQVLQSGQRDTSAGLYLFTDSNRYLINTGENTLRHLRDSGLPTKALDRILLTGSSINHIGGLTNALLATQDRLPDDYPINVYGPPNLESYVQTIRKSFQYLSKFEFVKLNLINEKICWQEILKDENCTVFACAISDEVMEGDTKMIYPRLAVSYAFLLHEPLRRVSEDAMQELGVPDEMFRNVLEECQMGNTVRLPTGKVIAPDDILQAPLRKQSFVIIDCPSLQVLKTLSQFKLTEIFNQDLSSAHIDLIVHMTPQEIVTTAEYKSWMRTFDCETQHLLTHNTLNSNPPPTVFTFDKIYKKLNRDHPQVFPALRYSVLDATIVEDFDFPRTTTVASPSLKYVFRPQKSEGFVESALRTKVDSLLKTVRHKETAKIFRSLEEDNDFEVVFLGTGSRVSSVLRNTSGILLNLRDKTSLLLDCGEGTYRQLCYHYGDDIDLILKQLRTVFISHMHIDHHLGLINILLQRRKIMGNSDYVRIIGPESLDLFLRYFEMLSGESLNFRFTQFWWVKRGIGKKEGRAFSRSLGLSAISVIPTKHSDYSHGLVIERNGWKMVYSADTRPCKQLIDAGQNATLLIHEATFEDELLDRAKATSHCTVSEAIRCSELMRAEHTILTHISSRHLFPCRSSRLPHGVSFAFDHMTVQQKELPALQGIMPSLEKTVLQSQPGRRSRKKRKQEGIAQVSMES